MATIDEIMDAMPDEGTATGREYLVIDPETRTINVPESERIFGVEADVDAARKYFLCPRYVGDNLDLASMFLTVNYRNANGEEDGYLVEDVEIQGDYVTFSWQLWPNVVACKGAVQFAVCADLPNTTHRRGPDWNTTLASGEVLEGLDPNRGDVDGETSDVVTQLRAEVSAQTAAVEAAGAAQVDVVEAAGAAATADARAQIEAKSAATLATIPADYTTMSGTVDRLHQEKADAYMVTTEAAASHEIHAQDCTLQASVWGATTQEGEGDPARDNVRQIIGVGYDGRLVLTGEEEVVNNNESSWTPTRSMFLIVTAADDIGGAVIMSHGPTAFPLDGSASVTIYPQNNARVYFGGLRSVIGSNTDSVKAYLAAQYAAGTPVTIWYKKATHAKGAPYYIGLATEDTAGNYRAVAAEIGTTPLFDGDTVEPWVRSGCDVKLTLDGTEVWSLDDNGTPHCPVPAIPAAKNRVQYSNLYESTERNPAAVPPV